MNSRLGIPRTQEAQWWEEQKGGPFGYWAQREELSEGGMEAYTGTKAGTALEPQVGRFRFKFRCDEKMGFLVAQW